MIKGKMIPLEKSVLLNQHRAWSSSEQSTGQSMDKGHKHRKSVYTKDYSELEENSTPQILVKPRIS